MDERPQRMRRHAGDQACGIGKLRLEKRGGAAGGGFPGAADCGDAKNMSCHALNCQGRVRPERLPQDFDALQPMLLASDRELREVSRSRRNMTKLPFNLLIERVRHAIIMRAGACTLSFITDLVGAQTEP
jgi:hypothetical protein